MSRILVIDDEEELRLILQEALEGAGYEVALAPDGRQGLAQLERQRADVVITDIFMPAQDGIETILEIRQRFPGVKVIAMSGGGVIQRLDYLKAAQHLGADVAVPKPFNCDLLIQAIRRMLEDREPRAVAPPR